MLVNRKTVVTNVTFTKEEVETFKNLKTVISECCDSFSECSTFCPLHDWCCISSDAVNELDNFEKLKEG